MEYKKLSKLQKWYLKYTDRPAYKQYKSMLKDYDFYHFSKGLPKASVQHSFKAITTFKHSGNSGDIIYSLPAAFELSKGGKTHFYLHANQPGDYQNNYHPLGNVMLSDKMVDMLKPLLQYQPQIEVAEKYNGEALDYDLDEFRKHPILLDRGSITQWYFLVYAIYHDTSKPWLIAPKDEQYADTLVIARSHRYRSPGVDFSFLKKYSRKIFLGVKEEYEDMKTVLPDLEFKPVKDFLEMATIINSCKLFIGNQSFPFSIAEALKAKRLLEVYYKAPNVIPEGEGANVFMYQAQFEYQVERLLAQ